jgi:hypothetical protein
MIISGKFFDRERKQKLEEFTAKHWLSQGSLVTGPSYKIRRSKIPMSSGAVVTDFFPATGTIQFLVRPTFSNNVKSVDMHGNFKNDTAYEANIRLEDWGTLLKSDEWKTVSLENFRALIQLSNLKFSCTCPSYHWTGISYNLDIADSSINPQKIPDPIWRNRHGVYKLPTLCKHLQEIVNSLIFRTPEILNQLRQKIK